MRRAFVLIALAIALIATTVLSLRIGIADSSAVIIAEIRAPRIALGVIVGAGLGISGALLQGSLRNPLADPAIIGVSAGAALGAVAAVAFGAAYGSPIAALVATVGGVIAIVIAMWISRGRDGHSEVVTLILGGVAITAFAVALLSIVVTLSDSAGARSTTFWTTGSLALATWPGVITTLPFLVVGAVIAAVVARPLDVFSLGDRAARASGVAVDRVRLLALTGAVTSVAAGVAVVGVIAFVGLVVPHAVRLLIGPRHGGVLIGSAFLGALLLLWADTIARTVAAPVEIPLGVVTAVIGAPAFLLLLRRTRARQGGWA